MLQNEYGLRSVCLCAQAVYHLSQCVLIACNKWDAIQMSVSRSRANMDWVVVGSVQRMVTVYGR